MTSSSSTPVARGEANAMSPAIAAFFALAAGAMLYAHRLAFLTPTRASADATQALDHALHDPAMLDPTLGLVAAALLAYRRRDALATACATAIAPSAPQRCARSVGGLALGCGAALLVWSRQIDGRHLVLLAALSSLVGAALVLGGPALLRALAGPLVPLVLAVPLPPQLIHAIVFPMQLVTVELASALLDGVGRMHEVRGDLVISRGVVFRVVEGCSGFKSMVSLVLAAVVYGELVLERPAARAGLVLLALPIGLAMNGLRVLALIVGEIPAETPEHVQIGLAALVGGVMALALVEFALSKGAARLGQGGVPATAPQPILRSAGPMRPRAWIAVGLLWLGAAAATELLPIARWPVARGRINIETLPEEIEGRSGRSIPIDDAFFGSATFGHWIQREYAPHDSSDSNAPQVADASDAVRVFIGHEDVARVDRTGYAPKTRIPASGWKARRRVANADSGSAAESAVDWEAWIVDYPNRRVLVLHGRSGYAPWGLEAAGRWLGLDRMRRERERRSPLVIRLERDQRGRDTGADWMILRQFARRIESWSAQSGA